jgi:hypothetical protein
VKRSILAILAGFVAVVVTHLGTDALMHATGIFPAWGEPMSDVLFAVATLYRTLWGIAGSALTAYLAPNRPIGHALVGGAIGMVLATAGAIATWNAGPAFGPHWYPLILIALALPQSWLGAKLAPRPRHATS